MSEFDHFNFLQHLTQAPGVYQMFNLKDEVIYVGKAKNLKKRLSSYFVGIKSGKTRLLVSHIHHIDVTVTENETQALILENDYIKQLQPKYNVLLRDDKSYPFIFICEHKHPKMTVHRGPKRMKGDYFGPYPNGGAVRESLQLMQKLFPIRQCEDSYYRNRSRPCLMYQLNRCLATCVKGFVSDEEYEQQVELSRLFLRGDSQKVLSALVEKMEQASSELKFELAARYRDQILSLRRVQEQQWINGTQDDVDIIGLEFSQGVACFHLLFMRQGKVIGNRSYFPKIPKDTSMSELLNSFLLQFYLNTTSGKKIPRQILCSFDLFDKKELEITLMAVAGYKVTLHNNTRGERLRLVNMANANAKLAQENKLVQKSTIAKRFQLLEQALEVSDKINRMECFDISHTSGEQTVASCVVFNNQGPVFSEYRRFNISGITPGDDYAAMRQVLLRRYSKKIPLDKTPDIIFIDGGKGQLTQAEEVLLGVDSCFEKKPMIVGIAKGEGRKPGLETLIIAGSRELIALENDSPALHLIQHIRDESHRFAITGHRARRQKEKNTSYLESIPGVGAKRRQNLIKFMGGMQALKGASVDEIVKVPGISRHLAQLIYDALRN